MPNVVTPSRLAYNLQRTVDPTEEPIDKATAKLACRVEEDETYFDAWFDGHGGIDSAGAIPAARDLVEHNASVALMPQTWVLRLDEWPDGDVIDLLVHPVQSVTVAYEDINDATQTLAATEYELQRSEYRSLLMKTDSAEDFPSLSTSDPRPISITMTSGFSNTTDQTTVQARRDKVPPAAKMAMLMLISHWFKNPETVVVGVISKEIEYGYRHLISRIRRGRYA